MKKFFICLVAILFVGCEQGYVPMRVTTQYSTSTAPETTTPETPKDTPKEKIVAKTLAPIDESIMYIWADDTKRCYYGNELPDGDGDIVPHPFLYTDGTIAEVVAFEYYRPDRHFYLKAHEIQPVETDGIVTSWKEVYRIFRQKDNVMDEAPSDTVFPAYDPIKLTEYKFGTDYVGETPDHWWVFFPSDEWGVRTGYCSWPMKYFSAFIPRGDTLWVVGESRDYDHPQIFTLGEACQLRRWMDYAKAVYKP